MKKAFYLLLALVSLAACKKDSPQPPQPTPPPAPIEEPKTTVTLDLAGELEAVGEAKALQFINVTYGGSFLRPFTYTNDRVKVIWTVYGDRTYARGEIEGTMEGDKVTLRGAIELPRRYIDPSSNEKVYLVLHLGDFEKVGDRYTLPSSQLVAPLYTHGFTSLTNARGHIPVAFCSKPVLLNRVDGENKPVGHGGSSSDVKAIRHTDLKLSLAGVFYDTEVINATKETVHISHFEVYGFGAKNTYLTTPSGGIPPSLAGDPASAGARLILINNENSDDPPTPSYGRIEPNKSSHYLVYVPADGSIRGTEGHLEVSIVEAKTQGWGVTLDRANRPIPQAHAGKIARTTVRISPR